MNWYSLYWAIMGNGQESERRLAMLMAIAWRELANGQNTFVLQPAFGYISYHLLQHLDNNGIPVPFDAKALVNQ